MIQEMLYHYTTCSGLKGILKSLQLWFTNISCFEDTQEFIYTISAITQRLSLSATIAEEFLSFATHQNPFTFVFCFCKDADRKDLWQRYGRSGGYNIEFAEQDMRAIAEYQAGGTVRYRGGPSPCIYDKNRQNVLIENAVEQRKQDGHGISFDQVYHLATLFKQECFQPEQETRFVVRLGDLSAVKTRKVDGRTVKYWEMPLRSFAGWLPIRTITIGPTQNREKAVRDLRRILLLCGLKDISIKCSKVPYEDFAQEQLPKSECHVHGP